MEIERTFGITSDIIASEVIEVNIYEDHGIIVVAPFKDETRKYYDVTLDCALEVKKELRL